MELPKAIEEKKFDIRLKEKFLREDRLPQKELQEYLKTLSDDSDLLKTDDSK
jgi:hypothetical protein